MADILDGDICISNGIYRAECFGIIYVYVCRIGSEYMTHSIRMDERIADACCVRGYIGVYISSV